MWQNSFYFTLSVVMGLGYVQETNKQNKERADISSQHYIHVKITNFIYVAMIKVQT